MRKQSEGGLDGTVGDLGYPSVQVQGISGAVSASAGAYHSLVLAQDGTVWEWGDDYFNEKTSWPRPRQVAGLNGVIRIAACSRYSLALLNDGPVGVWGYD